MAWLWKAVFGVAALALGAAFGITIEYPAPGSVFPPDICAPTFVYRDKPGKAERLRIRIEFVGVAPTIELRTVPSLKPAEFSWKPDDETWAAIKKHLDVPITVTIENPRGRARVTIYISKDPVGAPIFYRDVPLMPEEAEKRCHKTARCERTAAYRLALT